MAGKLPAVGRVATLVAGTPEEHSAPGCSVYPVAGQKQILGSRDAANMRPVQKFGKYTDGYVD